MDNFHYLGWFLCKLKQTLIEQLSPMLMTSYEHGLIFISDIGYSKSTLVVLPARYMSQSHDLLISSSCYFWWCFDSGDSFQQHPPVFCLLQPSDPSIRWNIWFCFLCTNQDLLKLNRLLVLILFNCRSSRFQCNIIMLAQQLLALVFKSTCAVGVSSPEP